MFAQLAPFLAVSILVIISPGPDTAVVVRNSVWGGRKSGAAAAIGVVAGLATWTVAASLGVAALIQASEPAFVALKLMGAAYLVYLGAQALRAAFRSRRDRPSGAAPGPRRIATVASARQGLMSNLANPKIAVFFTTFLPQFAPGRHPSFGVLLLLGMVFCGITLVWFLGYAAVAAAAAERLNRPRVRAVLEGITGVVLIGFGLRLATERR